jgi:hypothetical protein
MLASAAAAPGGCKTGRDELIQTSATVLAPSPLRTWYRTALRPRGLRISFDLDDTLTGLGPHMPVESGAFPRFVQRHLGESLRHGTRRLMRELRRQGHSVWIYTSSGRSPERIRRWLLLHGIRVDGIVNDERHHHTARVHGARRWPSKFPPAFGIDLHVDDSEGVAMEGAAHGFRVVLVTPDDPHWDRKVLHAARACVHASR